MVRSCGLSFGGLTVRPNGIAERERNEFRISFASDSRYRYRQKINWKLLFVADADASVLRS